MNFGLSIGISAVCNFKFYHSKLTWTTLSAQKKNFDNAIILSHFVYGHLKDVNSLKTTSFVILENNSKNDIILRELMVLFNGRDKMTYGNISPIKKRKRKEKMIALSKLRN